LSRRNLLVIGVAVMFIASCINIDSRRTSIPTPKDGPPMVDIDIATVPDAVPKSEPVTAAGNKNPYTVNGVTYHLLPAAQGYRKVGLASWYGTKFHGNKTSNGETYDMYTMTAAHRTLPIPAYAKVSNLANNRSVIVRINDRGPFHADRIIDLSYAAAKKLGFAEHGTARVEVTVIDPIAFQANTVASPAVSVQPALAPAAAMPNQEADTASRQPFLQVGAYTSRAAAVKSQQKISGVTSYPVAIEKAVLTNEKKTLFKVLVGPITDLAKLQILRGQLIDSGFLKPFVVYAESEAAML
jgi:rare lipoprotein A